MICRCGANDKEQPHPCHGQGYACRKPAKLRFYAGRFVSLSGMQMKVEVSSTYACDECWADYTAKNPERVPYKCPRCGDITYAFPGPSAVACKWGRCNGVVRQEVKGG